MKIKVGFKGNLEGREWNLLIWGITDGKYYNLNDGTSSQATFFIRAISHSPTLYPLYDELHVPLLSLV